MNCDARRCRSCAAHQFNAVPQPAAAAAAAAADDDDDDDVMAAMVAV